MLNDVSKFVDQMHIDFLYSFLYIYLFTISLVIEISENLVVDLNIRVCMLCVFTANRSDGN